MLEQESGYSLEATDVAHFRESILSGIWPTAEAALERMSVGDTDGLMVRDCNFATSTYAKHI